MRTTKTIKIAVITGTRADYGLLIWLLRELEQDSDFEVFLVATGMHLSGEFGDTKNEITKDGFSIYREIPILLGGDDGPSIARSVGVGTIAMAECLSDIEPDCLVILGDRFEMLAAATAALFLRIPIAHIGGGDITEGAFDDNIRHCITKMSTLHFVTNRQSMAVVAQLGEPSSRIFNVGSPGLEYLSRVPQIPRDQLELELQFRFCQQNVLVTYHPETLSNSPVRDQIEQVLRALDRIDPSIGIVFTKSNADTGGREINDAIDAYVRKRKNTKAFASLGQAKYLSTLKQCDVVAGNSSSGIYEAPSVGTYTVNIGERQKGRLMAPSVMHCPTVATSISEAIESSLTRPKGESFTNPYASSSLTSQLIVQTLKSSPLLGKSGLKTFTILNHPNQV